MTKRKWFEPNPRSLNWSKDDTIQRRRRNALKARYNNPLKAARALQALSNVTLDLETKRKSRADALYFFKLYERKQNIKRKGQ